MGMSASQARFLSLTARKTNVEFQGQQINQQRTALSNESSNYYSQLTSMAVPVPPSISDYTRITYTFDEGNVKNTVTSLVTTKDTAKSGLYKLNYTQEIPTNSMIVNGTSVVTKTNDKFNIGSIELQPAGDDDYSIDKFTKAGIPYDVVVGMSEKERQDKLAVEQLYVAIASEKYGNDDWVVRYCKNSSDASYEPVLYSLKELQNANYNQKTGASLSGIKQYVFGETTETKEIKNAQAKLTQDTSGRYQTITIYTGDDIKITTTQGDTRTEEQKNAADLWRSQEPDLNDYVDSYSSPELFNQYKQGSYGCYDGASHGNANCFKHILAHMLDLSLNSDGSVNPEAYPKNYSSSISNGVNDISITYENVYISRIRVDGSTPDMLGISDKIKNGFIPEGKNRLYTITTSPYTSTSSEFDKFISSYYISRGNSTNTQKLLSNYCIDANGNIVNKTLEQKCVDLVKAIDLYYAGQLEISDYSILSSILASIDNDIQTFTMTDKESYDEDMEKWMNSKPKYADPVIEDINSYSIIGNGTTYKLVTTTETDEAAYNAAMNQYYFDKAQYDQKVQNVNSKIEVIQNQDKNLELKLKQLDTEQNAIQTEMDAVKKVISKNVESSFKTFNA